ncbi:MAG: PhnD/SsuA/transferrin family substrate-binding protein [Eubacteriaceae bacterium]|nr:PhnD/SsuA/transferrin family substrate-binding protein [Eubacteriaceae bacterium]
MRKNKGSKGIAAILLVAIMALGMVGCGTNTPPASNNQGNSNAEGNNTTTNISPIIVTWYPNESSNTHEGVRTEISRLIEQATGRKVEHKLTTDYTIAIEAIASGSADIAMAMGAVGYIEAKNRNPQVDVLFVNSDKNGKLDEAKYFSWLCVALENAAAYKSGNTYSIDNIKGKKISFVSNSSTSGFKVPASSIIEHFPADQLDEDKLIEGGRNNFFNEVYFGGSHQGSAVNLLNGSAEVAAFCDTELLPYIELKSGEDNTIGAVYTVRAGADAPFDQYAGYDFIVIAAKPVFNGPNAYNPKNLSEAEIKAIRDLFTSEEVSSNEILFYDADIEGAIGLYKKSSSYGYVLTSDSWYDPYR